MAIGREKNKGRRSFSRKRNKKKSMKLVDDLQERGLIDQVSHQELLSCLDSQSLDVYMGIDPTFHSLQFGNLFALITLRRLQKEGHRPWVVLGGATAMIGDPSGKNTERPLLSEEQIAINGKAIKGQLQGLLDFEGKNGAVVLDNRDWTVDKNYLHFLRDVGKYFRLSDMLSRDSVKGRLGSGAGMNYTEFSYQVLQAYDFMWLYKNRNIRLQVGASDQWGNIVAGIDLVRKKCSEEVFGLTFPLVTDHMGRKFGKSEEGALFLDPKLTSPYQLYQYLLNTDDSKALEYLKFFTELSCQEIEELGREQAARPEERVGQKALANEVVQFLHGGEGLSRAKMATDFFFGNGDLKNIRDEDVEGIVSHLPSLEYSSLNGEGVCLFELLAATPLFQSKGEVRRAVGQKGVYFNNHPLAAEKTRVYPEDLVGQRFLVVRRGKKHYALVRFSL